MGLRTFLLLLRVDLARMWDMFEVGGGCAQQPLRLVLHCVEQPDASLRAAGCGQNAVQGEPWHRGS